MPGRASRANARSDGSALLSDWSAGRPTFRTSRSCGIVAFRLSSWTAKAAIVRLRFVTKPLSASSLRASAPNTFPWLLSRRERSWFSVPRYASETWALSRYARSQ